MRMRWLGVVALFVVLILAGCDGDDADDVGLDDDDEPSEYVEPFRVAIEQGNLQAGFVGDQLVDSLAVSVHDDQGSPVSGRLVRFVALEGAGEGKARAIFETDTAVTDENGRAACRATLGDTPGIARARAELVDPTGRPATFTLSAYPQPTAGKKPICLLLIRLYARRTN